MVLPDSDGISRVPPYSGYIQERTKFRLRGCYLYDGPFWSLRLPRSFVTPYRMSYNPKRQASWFGLCSVSLAATQEIAFAFSSSVYLDVSVPGSVFLTLCIQIRIPYHYVWWVSHSEIFGSKLTYSSPKHIGVSPSFIDS